MLDWGNFLQNYDITCKITPIPMCSNQLVVLWINQNPGLFATNRIKVNPASGTATVSFSGGSLRFRIIFPFLLSSFTFSLVIVFPVGVSKFLRNDSVLI